MNYQQIFPSEPLRRYIRYFWTLEDGGPNFSERTFKIMSDGLPGLIFQANKKSFLISFILSTLSIDVLFLLDL